MSPRVSDRFRHSDCASPWKYEAACSIDLEVTMLTLTQLYCVYVNLAVKAQA